MPKRKTKNKEEKEEKEEEEEEKEEEQEEEEEEEEKPKPKGRSRKGSGLNIERASQVSKKDFDDLSGRVGVLEGIGEMVDGLVESLTGEKLKKPKKNGKKKVAEPIKTPRLLGRKFGSVGTIFDEFMNAEEVDK